MKYLSILLCLFLCYELSSQHRIRGFGPERRMRDAIFEECAKDAGVTVEELDALDSGEAREKFLNGDGDYRNVGCFSACLLQRHGFMDGDTFAKRPTPDYAGSLDEHRDNFIKGVRACEETAEGAGDACDVALAFEVCMEKTKDAL
nr:uncharacterized protein LOC117225682 [Megalopta genalis]